VVKDFIILQDIKKVYQVGKNFYEVLRGINLTVSEGDFLAIMGPSGGGKSTLLNIIGLLDKPTSGKYFFEGQEVSKFNKNKLAYLRNKKIGFIFQAFYLVPWATVLENVLMPLIYRGNITQKDKDRAMFLLEKLNLADKANFKPAELSGGQQQRVAIARALINNPKLILADEPTGNLDSKSGQEVIDIFENLNNQGITIIIVTHDPEIAKRAKKIKFLKDGKFVEN